jgi:hypothetical protein
MQFETNYVQDVWYLFTTRSYWELCLWFLQHNERIYISGVKTQTLDQNLW